MAERYQLIIEKHARSQCEDILHINNASRCMPLFVLHSVRTRTAKRPIIVHHFIAMILCGIRTAMRFAIHEGRDRRGLQHLPTLRLKRQAKGVLYMRVLREQIRTTLLIPEILLGADTGYSGIYTSGRLLAFSVDSFCNLLIG